MTLVLRMRATRAAGLPEDYTGVAVSDGILVRYGIGACADRSVGDDTSY